MKVLLVEDSPTLRYSMSNYIEEAGHEVICAPDGETALQIVESSPVDFIFMDVQMPGLDGFETTRLIREGMGDFWVPIVFVTGEENDSSYSAGIEAGGDDYLIKPLSAAIVKAKIRAMERIVEMRNQLTQLNQELREVSQRDGLTNLFNRHTFDEKATEQWKLATRNHDPMTMLLIDIDHFKLYNDTYGHPAGDECIVKVVEVLKACMSRPGDIVARFGGEEFIALLPNTPECGAQHITQEIHHTLHELNIRHRTSLSSDRVSVSIGGSIINYTTGTNLAEQIKYADQALYQSKKRGRNCATIRPFRPHRKVFVVDNDEESLQTISNALEGHCFLLTSIFQDGYLEKILEFNPDLLILHIDNAESPGLKCFETLQKDAKYFDKPKIILSNADTDELAKFREQISAAAWISKPIDKHQLVARVNEYLL